MRNLILAALLLPMLMLPIVGFGDVLRHPYKAEIGGLRELKHSLESGKLKQHGRGFRRIEPLRINGYVSGEGVVQLTFRKARSQDWSAWVTSEHGTSRDSKSVVLLKGQMETARSARPVAGTIVLTPGEAPQITISFEERTARSTPRLVKLIAPLTDRQSEVAHVKRASGRNAAAYCGAQSPAKSHQVVGSTNTNSSIPETAAATLLQADISTDADPEFYSIYNSNTNSQIATVLNEVDTIYTADLGMTLNLVAQHVYTSGGPYTTDVADTLIDDFQAHGESTAILGNADIYHLFTGKTMLDAPGGDPGIIGIAFTGVVCAFPDYSYGITQYTSATIMPITTAHEIGHNFDASHDTQIMGASLNGGNLPTHFSAFSINEILNFVSANDGCLATATTGPTPTPTIPPGGGSSGTTPAGDPMPIVSQATTLQSDGTFTAVVSLSAVAAGCDVTLTASGKNATVNSGTELARSAADNTTKTFSGIINRRTYTYDDRGRRIKTFVGAQVTCPASGGISAAGSVNIRSNRVRSVPYTGGKRFRTALAAAVEPTN